MQLLIKVLNRCSMENQLQDSSKLQKAVSKLQIYAQVGHTRNVSEPLSYHSVVILAGTHPSLR